MIYHKSGKSFMKAEMDPAKSQGFLLKTLALFYHFLALEYLVFMIREHWK